MHARLTLRPAIPWLQHRASGRDGGVRAQADASSTETAIGGFEARQHPAALLQMVERWHELCALIGDVPPLYDGQPFDWEALIRAGDHIHERTNIEKQIVANPARGDADLIAKAGALRRLLEEDGNAEDRCGKLTLSVLDDIEQTVGDQP
jgi:hypothetical protein